MRYVMIFVLICLLMPAGLYGQTPKLDIGGELRIRTEIDNKDFNNDTDPYSFSLLRTRLHVKARFTDGLTTFVQLQDSRVHGEEPSTMAATNNVDLHQAYVQVDSLFWKWLSLKMGRMEMAYGNQRLISGNWWNNVGRAFDGGMLSLTFKPIQLDLISAKTHETMQPNDQDNGDQTFAGLYAHLKTLKPHTLQFYMLAESDERENEDEKMNKSIGTLGSYFHGKFGNFDTEIELAFQGGTMDYEETDVQAFMFTAKFGYLFPHRVKPYIAIGFDAFSGDDPETEEYEAFSNRLFGAGHKFYGCMDYFTNIIPHTNGLGLTDVYLTAKIKPMKKMTLKADVYVFSLNQNATLSDGSESKNIGAETDLSMSYQYLKNLTFMIGMSVFAPDDVFKDWKGEDEATWSYLQTLVKF